MARLVTPSIEEATADFAKDHKKPGPTSKYADGSGLTKTDELIRRLKYGLKYDPLVELVKLAKSQKTTASEKIRIASELLSYYQPKLKPMEMNPNEGEVINVNIMYEPARTVGQSEVSAQQTATSSLEELAKL